MNRVSKVIAITMAATIGGLSAAAPASAGDWRRHHHQNNDNSDAIALGIAGLAIGVIAGAALSDSGPSPVYEQPVRRYYEPPRVYEEPRVEYHVRYYQPQYRSTLEPWSRDWYRYCMNRYRSFNPRNGTYTGYDGDQHFCVAN